MKLNPSISNQFLTVSKPSYHILPVREPVNLSSTRNHYLNRVTTFFHIVGSSPLSVQFWEVYVICNQQLSNICSIWDGEIIKLSFRRNFSPQLMERWFELEQIILGTTLTSEQDALIWKYTSSGTYSTSSLYSIINFRGIVPIFIPAMVHCSPL